MKRERKIDFRIYTSVQTEVERGRFKLVIECGTKKKLNKSDSGRDLVNNGYILQESACGPYVIDENQSFKMKCRGNMGIWNQVHTQHDLVEDSVPKQIEDNYTFDFLGKKGYKQIHLEMVVADEANPTTGNILIEKRSEEKEIVYVHTVGSGGFCKGKNKMEAKEKIKVSYMKLATYPIEIVLPKPPKIVEFIPASVIKEQIQLKQLTESLDKFETENPSEVPGLDCKTMKDIGLQMTKDEAHQFGTQVGLNKNDIEALLSKNNAPIRILVKYRGRRPHNAQIPTIFRALETIKRPDLAEIFEEAIAQTRRQPILVPKTPPARRSSVISERLTSSGQRQSLRPLTTGSKQRLAQLELDSKSDRQRSANSSLGRQKAERRQCEYPEEYSPPEGWTSGSMDADAISGNDNDSLHNGSCLTSERQISSTEIKSTTDCDDMNNELDNMTSEV